MEYLSPCGDQGHFGVILCNCLEIACNSKTDGCRAKLIEIWHSRVIVQHICGTFPLICVQGSVRALNVMLTQTWLSVERFRLKCSTMGH